MIIPRKYEWFGYLYEHDMKSKELVDELFADYDESHAITKEKILKFNYYRPVAYMGMGCGIPGEIYNSIKKEFEKLDKSDPYDNGLTFKDVTRIEHEVSRKGTAIQMKFVSEMYDYPQRIVAFGSLENRDGEIVLGDGWEMTPPLS